MTRTSSTPQTSVLTSDEASYLGENIRYCRERRGVSQAQIAKLAGIPRATWTNLESGTANPTLAVLIKAANALQVRLDELLTQRHPEVRVTRVSELPVRKRGRVSLRLLLPEALAGLSFERMNFPPGGRLAGVPHTAGTREFLTCERGSIKLVASGESYQLGPGDVVAFHGDQKHSYINLAPGESVAYSVIAFAPLGR